MNVHDDANLRMWAERLKTDPLVLKAVVKTCGTELDTVEKALRARREAKERRR